MTGFNKVFIDTAPLIYFLDEDKNFGQKVKSIFSQLMENKVSLVSSVVTGEEYLIVPYRTENEEKVNAFMNFISDCDISLFPISFSIAQKAAQIRAKFPFIKGMDSLQLATSVLTGCDLFLTNDKQLKQFDEIKCVTVEEYSI